LSEAEEVCIMSSEMSVYVAMCPEEEDGGRGGG
jgi:hypothetical protein